MESQCTQPKNTIVLLRTIYDHRIISGNAHIPWPQRSTDLTGYTRHFNWGHLKEQVYVNKPQTLQQLKEKISAEIQAITLAALNRIKINVVARAHACKLSSGGYLREIILHT